MFVIMRINSLTLPVLYLFNIGRSLYSLFFFFQAEDGIRYLYVTGVQTCALPISAWLKSNCVSKAFFGLKPRSTVIALPSPRSETKAAVTVTQQSAICAASSTSRSAQRRPAANWLPPPLIVSFGSVLNICRSGISPKTTPAATEIRNAIRINDGCGRTKKSLRGYLVGGCQLARPVSAIHANPQANAPPRIEITKASTRSCRRMRHRLDPSAMRMDRAGG